MSKVKGYLILTNWLIVIILILALGLVIGMTVSAFYHRNSVLAPYFAIAPQIWGMFVVVSFVLATTLTIIKNTLSVKEIYLSMAGVYSILLIIAIIALLRVQPVPNYFIQTVGNTQYKIPREYTKIQNHKSAVRLDMCIETLKGVYESSLRNCDYQIVLLSSEPIQKRASFELATFIKENQEFNLNSNKITVSNEATKYQLSKIDKLKSYTIASNNSKIIHLQINEQNELIRFVICRKFRVGTKKGYTCQHWVNTDQGILNYEFKETADFDLKNWQQRESRILNLISQWKIN